jgi:UDP-2,3-diacylglucosamine pyrophosphatase LpxH
VPWNGIQQKNERKEEIIMAQDRALTLNKLSQLWKRDDVKVLPTKGKKYIIMSDIHLGDGKKADDFHQNEKALTAALTHYNKNGYNLILLGDIEELWQFALEEIKGRYQNTIYKTIKAFGDDHVYRVCGNHDLEWCPPTDPIRNTPLPYTSVTEALKMKDNQENTRILLVHGHHGDENSDKQAWRSRFFVRIYRGIEKLWKFDPHTSATKSQIKKDYERILYACAKKLNVILICGHSHRAIFASTSYVERLREKIAEREAEIFANPNDTKLIEKNRKDIKELRKKLSREKRKKREIDSTEPRGKPSPCYFNTGCALYTDGITAIEIANGQIKLVKWHKDTTRRPRFEVYESGSLSTYSKQLVQ